MHLKHTGPAHCVCLPSNCCKYQILLLDDSGNVRWTICPRFICITAKQVHFTI